MMVYDWGRNTYVDLLQLALDWRREDLPPAEVLDYLVEHCLAHELPILVTDLPHLVDLAFRASAPVQPPS